MKIIRTLSKNQNWAKGAPWLGLISAILLFVYFKPSEAMFWTLINIPLYLFHQTEEHYWPGGFKDYVNKTVLSGKKILTFPAILCQW